MQIFTKLIFLTVLCTVSAFLENLPSGSLLENAEVIRHRQKVCIFKVGDERCYDSNKPIDKEEIMKIFDVHKDTMDRNEGKSDEE